MNRGVLQSSVMQQMMGSENPNWWNMINSGTLRTTTATTTTQQSSSPNNVIINNNSPNNILFPHSSLPFPTSNWYYDVQDQLPESWSQLLLGGLVGEDDQKGIMGMFQAKKLEDWEEEILNNSSSNNNNGTQLHHQHQQQQVDHVKKEHSAHASSCTYVYGGGGGGDDYQMAAPKQNWSSPMIPDSSPQSCVTSFSSNMLDFSNNNNSPPDSRPRQQHPPPDRSSECNSNATGGTVKKARVQSSSNQTTFKVRKEKLGDRITALHQLVSPFGKTDTASVLLEAIGYIRFLHSQIEALSLPYLGNTSGSTRQQQQHSVQGERNCVFPEDPGQLLNENCLKMKGVVSEQDEEPKKDLRSRGLCLVPVSCTLQVGSDNGADYWAPAFGGGGGGGGFR